MLTEALARGSPEGSVTAIRNSPVLLWASSGTHEKRQRSRTILPQAARRSTRLLPAICDTDGRCLLVIHPLGLIAALDLFCLKDALCFKQVTPGGLHPPC